MTATTRNTPPAARRMLCMLGAALCLAPWSARAGEVRTDPGLATVMLATLEGTVRVEMPRDVAPGDTISGTVTALPAGEKERRQRRNRRALEELGISVAGQPLRVDDDGRFTVRIPPAAVGLDRVDVVLHPAGGGPPADREVLDQAGVKPASPAVPAPQGAAPQVSLPTLGQVGQPLLIPGSFDGNLADTALTVGGETAAPRAESPRGAVFTSPDVVGLVPVELREGERVTRGEMRNVRIGLSAPKTNLLRGETTVVTTVVTGLEDLDHPVPLVLRNETPGVVSLGGGNLQVWTIDPAAAPGGSFERTRTATGVSTGGFAVSARLTLPQEPPAELLPENPLLPVVFAALFPGHDFGELAPRLRGSGALLWRAFELPEGQRELPTAAAATSFARLAAYLLGSRFGLGPEEVDRAMIEPPEELRRQARQACDWALDTVEPPGGPPGGGEGVADVGGWVDVEILAEEWRRRLEAQRAGDGSASPLPPEQTEVLVFLLAAYDLWREGKAPPFWPPAAEDPATLGAVFDHLVEHRRTYLVHEGFPAFMVEAAGNLCPPCADRVPGVTILDATGAPAPDTITAVPGAVVALGSRPTERNGEFSWSVEPAPDSHGALGGEDLRFAFEGPVVVELTYRMPSGEIVTDRIRVERAP